MAKRRPDKVLYWEQSNLEIPVHVYREWRKSSRISIGKKAIHIRVPYICRGSAFENELNWMQGWLRKQFRSKPQLKERFNRSLAIPKTGDQISLFDLDYTLVVSSIDGSTGRALLRENNLHLLLPVHMAADRVPLLISRAFSERYRDHFEKKVHVWNERYFQKPIKGIRLKYNKSNWGSCSNKGMINLSTRLLLTPESVQDYVVVHELAHLIEMNHSARFWKVVERVMPDYQDHVEWLKKEGPRCYF